MMTSLPAPPQVMAILARLVEERVGLHYGPDDWALLADKITPRAVDAGFDSLLDYYYFLRYDPGGEAEFEALLENLVVRETYFFREADQLRILADELVPGLIAAGLRPRIWSAACSTGEEPLTVAMLLQDRGLLEHVDLVASDISPQALEHARAGRFGSRSLRALPPGVEGRWIEVRSERAAVRRDLIEAIQWRRVNLLDTEAVEALGLFDAVVCRNVLIYFNDVTIRRVVDNLARALRPGGRLLVGASESLLRFGTALQCEERRGVFFYTKVGG